MKNRKFLLAAVVLAALTSEAAHADLAEVGHDIKTTTKSAAKKTGHAAREAGHATANAAREVGHDTANVARKVGHGIANTTRHGYQSVKQAVHKTSDGEHS
ncbi:MAG TPA: hypothetical protein VGG24_10250 [Paraburkholderia sp.]|jgi:hypothetical protein